MCGRFWLMGCLCTWPPILGLETHVGPWWEGGQYLHHGDQQMYTSELFLSFLESWFLKLFQHPTGQNHGVCWGGEDMEGSLRAHLGRMTPLTVAEVKKKEMKNYIMDIFLEWVIQALVFLFQV